MRRLRPCLRHSNLLGQGLTGSRKTTEKTVMGPPTHQPALSAASHSPCPCFWATRASERPTNKHQSHCRWYSSSSCPSSLSKFLSPFSKYPFTLFIFLSSFFHPSRRPSRGFLSNIRCRCTGKTPSKPQHNTQPPPPDDNTLACGILTSACQLLIAR